MLRNFAAATQRLTGSTIRLETIGEVVIHPVSADRIDDWLAFFDHDAFAGDPVNAVCYCSGPTLPADTRLDLRPWRENRACMVDELCAGQVVGYLAYVDDRPAGWVNASLRAACPAVRRGVDDGAVISLTCFLIAPPYRRHGLARGLLQRVIDDAPARQARWIEAYPSETEHNRGNRSLFADHGFSIVDHRADKLVMRRSVS